MTRSYSNSGFSLLETIITIGLFSIAVYLFAQFVQTNITAGRFTDEQGRAVTMAQRSVEMSLKEIREASFAESGDFPILSATDQEVIFYSDIDADEAVERIRYTLTGTDLQKGVIKPSDDINPVYDPATEVITTLAEFVRNGEQPLFYYYDSFAPTGISTPLTTPLNPLVIKLIRMRLVVNIDPNRAPQDIVLESFVTIRNLKPQW